MDITLRFFASVRETLGTGLERVTVPDSIATVADLRACLVSRGGVWSQALGADRALRMACDQTMCQPATLVRDGCEVAFFPPVTGG